jgi:phosphoribosyl-AMP cyclohydrolase
MSHHAALPDDLTILGDVRFDTKGLVPAIVQEATSKDVLMLAYMNREALRLTLTSGRTWFYSRSRQALWAKGETSGNRQRVRRVMLDCDGDAIVVEVDQQGTGACHTGAWSCFAERFANPRGSEKD